MKKLSIILIILLMIYGASCSTNGYYPQTRKFYIKGRTIDTLGNPVPNLALFFIKQILKPFSPVKTLDSLSFKSDANGNFSFSREYENINQQEKDCNYYQIGPKEYSGMRLARSYSFTGECKGDSIIFRQLIFLPK